MCLAHGVCNATEGPAMAEEAEAARRTVSRKRLSHGSSGYASYSGGAAAGGVYSSCNGVYPGGGGYFSSGGDW